MKSIDRHRFLRQSASLAAGAAVAGSLASESGCGSSDGAGFHADWAKTPDRVWIGREFWANPLQDWRVSEGRVECHFPSMNRQLHLLTHGGTAGAGRLEMNATAGRLGGGSFAGPGSVGFRLGSKGRLEDYRHALVHGRGLDVGLTGAGGLFIGDINEAEAGAVNLDRASVALHLAAEATEAGASVTLMAHDGESGEMLGSVTKDGLPADSLQGGVALIANIQPLDARPANQQESDQAGAFWFDDWTVAGSLVDRFDDRAFGPILFAHYTLSRNVMKMTAQMPPVGADDAQTVALQVRKGEEWAPAAEAKIDPDARTATFRVADWDSTVDTPYRVVYTLSDTGKPVEHTFEGTIRRDPVDKPEITIADISCNAHYAFPNTACVESVGKLDPDLFCFTGDQYYEGTGGYGALRFVEGDRSILDMLRKWYQHGWTWRELIRDRPAVSIPDDHDVFHGNLWGEGGEQLTPDETQASAGYMMSPQFVNAVHRTQTAHHPDIPDPEPCKRGISVYFGDMVYGGVSWAIIADRQFKTAPEGKVSGTTTRADHVTDPNWHPKTADKPGFELLGDRQLRFLDDWAQDWRGAEMKAVISQTIFTAMATTHGADRMRLIADYDANGWPQTARDKALRAMRKAFPFHLAGDQHLAAVVHYGIDEQGDGPVGFAGPAVNNLYPRWFEPLEPGTNRPDGAPSFLGDFQDSFDNPMRVLACANPKVELRRDLLDREMDKAAGFGVAHFNKQARNVTVECWPLLNDPTQSGTQFPTWPVTVAQLDSYGAKQAGRLPKLEVSGVAKPVIQVIAEKNGEIVYTLRAPEARWQPFVFETGKYTVKVSDPESGKSAELTGLEAHRNNSAVETVTLT
ncbi:MAG: alkaline phosphatase D family protein [Bryobacterales bacterium]